MVLATAASANAELQLTISGPDQLAVNETATYTVSYSGISNLGGFDLDIIVDDVLKGFLSNVQGVPDPRVGPCTVTPITGGFEVSNVVDNVGDSFPADLFTIDLTATGTVGQVINVSMVENAFFDADFNPIEGATLQGKQVTIVSGTSSCTVPDEMNVPLADANAAIIAAGFTVGTITYHRDNDIPAGNVISTTPAGGIEADCGSAVAIVASTGPCLYVGRVFPATKGFSGLIVNSTHMARWVYLGKPNCWCCPGQKRGNGVYIPLSTNCRVDTVDLAAVKNTNAYMRFYTQTGYPPCSDSDLSGRIDTTELARMKNTGNYMQNVGCGPPCE